MRLWRGVARGAVDKEKVAFATQKQVLNALVLFYRDVCGRMAMDLQLKMRRTASRHPVILNRAELIGLIEELENRCRAAALLQYGSGLRIKELVKLRLKDVDLERGMVLPTGMGMVLNEADDRFHSGTLIRKR